MSRVLEARGLIKSYHERMVVNSVDICVKPGQVVGLLGPNGAGKTTTFKMILGLIKPDEGTVHFEKPLDGLPLHARGRLGLGYLPQGPSIFQGLTTKANLLALLEALHEPNPSRYADELLEKFSLSKLSKQKASTLSGGERRRLEFARALCSRPSILLCDEPFAGVDPLAAADITKAIEDLANSNVGVLLTDHNVRDALGVCNEVYLIVDGKIAEKGTPEQIIASPKAQKFYLGFDFD